jgi:hypothetical protein
LREFISNALAEKLREPRVAGKPWLKMFGELRDLREETIRTNAIIKAEFDELEPEEGL